MALYRANYEYYWVDSSSGEKTKIGNSSEELKNENYELSEQEIYLLKEIEELDEKFSAPGFSFFHENFVFYTRYYGESGPHISAEDWQDMRENFYKYNMDTKEIEQIKKQNADVHSGVSLEALMYIYPDLQEAISDKLMIEDKFEVIDRHSFDRLVYKNGRILFTTFYPSTLNYRAYLYEYIPSVKEIKMIMEAEFPIVSITFIKDYEQ